MFQQVKLGYFHNNVFYLEVRAHKRADGWSMLLNNNLPNTEVLLCGILHKNTGEVAAVSRDWRKTCSFWGNCDICWFLTTNLEMLHRYRFQKRYIVWGHKCDFGEPNGGDSIAVHQDRSWVFGNPVKSSRGKKKNLKISFTKRLHKTSQITGVWQSYSQGVGSQYSEKSLSSIFCVSCWSSTIAHINII